MFELDAEACYQAIQTHDPRFDGRLFVGVTSTGIYCRPVCPARPPRPDNCKFYPTAAAAHEAGFRPCLRCRPETAPDLGSWRGTSNTVSRGLALIAEGELDREGASVDALAERLGIGERQLRRLFQQHLGASPLAVAQTRRVLFAKQLIHETSLPMSEVAIAAGFGSVRRFNEAFQDLFGRSPSALRRAKTEPALAATGVVVRLRYRAPYDWPAMLSFLRARAIEGVEEVVDDRYRRVIAHDGDVGTIEVAHEPSTESLSARIECSNVRALASVVARVRRVFDLGADVITIGAHLATDPLLAPLIAARPGLRAPGAWDEFELAVRAILGQQVSVESARRSAGKLARLCGKRLSTAVDSVSSLQWAFPDAAELRAADLSALRLTGARKRALVALADAALQDPSLFQRLDTLEETIARFRSIPGIGDWTAHYIALRAAREPDAFPASDVGLLRAVAVRGVRPKPSDLLERSERWRPWRAYAAQHLWATDALSRPINEATP